MLGEHIFRLRKKQGLSQEQLGEIVHVTRQTISNWEAEETAPNPEQLKRLSEAFHVSIDALLDHDIQAETEKKKDSLDRIEEIKIGRQCNVGFAAVWAAAAFAIAFVFAKYLF